MTELPEQANLGPLYAALAKAQGAMTAASKDKNVGFDAKGTSVKYSYADLAEVWDTIRKPLADNALCVIQQIRLVNANTVTVNSVLGHSSGASINSELSMPVVGGTAQAVGSAIAYARRYSLMALVGVAADDDDDGKSASEKQTRPAPAHVTPTPAQKAPFVPDVTMNPPPSDDAVLRQEAATPAGYANNWVSNKGQLGYFWQEAKNLGYTINNDGKSSDPDRVHRVLGVDSLKHYPGTVSMAIEKLRQEAGT